MCLSLRAHGSPPIGGRTGGVSGALPSLSCQNDKILPLRARVRRRQPLRRLTTTTARTPSRPLGDQSSLGLGLVPVCVLVPSCARPLAERERQQKCLS